jgi:hypothetical protein
MMLRLTELHARITALVLGAGAFFGVSAAVSSELLARKVQRVVEETKASNKRVVAQVLEWHNGSLESIGELANTVEDAVQRLGVKTPAPSASVQHVTPGVTAPTSFVGSVNCQTDPNDPKCPPTVLTDADCKKRDACKVMGYCSAIPLEPQGRLACYPRTDADCAQSDYCLKFGACVRHPYKGGSGVCTGR